MSYVPGTPGQCNQSSMSRLEKESIWTVVRREKGGGQGGGLLGGEDWILLGCLQSLFSLFQDDAKMHHIKTPVQSRSISFPVVIHLRPRHTAMLHLSQNI